MVFALALLVRVLHVWQLQRAPFSHLLMGDALSYDRWAQGIAAGDWVGRDVFYQAPLYPYFLGAIYSLFGRDLTAVRLCQAIAGSGACAFVTIAGSRFFGARAGLASGLVLAVYAPALFFDALLQKTVLDGLLLSGLLVSVAPLGQPISWRRATCAGAALAGLALTRENALVLLPPLLVWVALRSGRRWTPSLSLLLGLTVVLAPVAIRNLVVGGELHLTTSQFGPNLYIGNHDGATGTYVPLRPYRGSAVHERQDAIELAEAALGRRLGPGEVSQYWRKRAIEWIASDPRGWLELMARKLLLVWNAVEAADTEDLYTHGGRSVLLGASSRVFHFGVIAPLGLLGVWLTRARWRELWVLYAIGALYAASVAFFYVLDRYRYPLVPLLVLFAGAAIVQLPEWWRRSGLGERGLGAAIAVVAALVCNWPLLSTAAMRGLTHYNIAYALQEEGRIDEAIAEYRHALRLLPRHAGVRSNLGVLLAAGGRRNEALALYREALEIDPQMLEARVNIGIELARSGDAAGAIAAFGDALARDPQNSRAHYNLGLVLASTGRLDDARRHFTETIRLEPLNAEAHNNLGIVLASQGHVDVAIQHFRTAVRLRPDFAGARLNLERAQELTGRR